MAGKRNLIVPKSRRTEPVEAIRGETHSYLENLPRVISRIGKVDETEVSTFRSERQRNSESLNIQTAQLANIEASENQDEKNSHTQSIAVSVGIEAHEKPRTTFARVKQHFVALREELASSDSKDEREWSYQRVIATSVASILVLVTVGIVWQMKYRANRRSNPATVVNSKSPSTAISDPTSKKFAKVKPKAASQSGLASLSNVAPAKSENSQKTGSPPKIYEGHVFTPNSDPSSTTSLPPLPNYLQSNNSQSSYASQLGPQTGGYSGGGLSNGIANPQPSPQIPQSLAMQPRMPSQMPVMRSDNPNVVQQTNPYVSQTPYMTMQQPSQNVPVGTILTPNANGYVAQPTVNQFQNSNGLFQQGSPINVAQQNVRSVPMNIQPQRGQAGGPVTYAPNGDVRLDGGIESIPIRR